MLSRTASHLYWMSRYLERAENIARMLDVCHSVSLLPKKENQSPELKAPLLITGTFDAFEARYPTLNAAYLMRFMALDAENEASIYNCLRLARENAHAVRGRITGEMWENINATWLEIKRLKEKDISSDEIGAFFEWVKDRSHLFRGVTYGTILRDEAFHFLRLGTFIERADNTLRILEVKHHLIEEDNVSAHRDAARDYYQWSTLLHSLSAFEAYHEIYRDNLSPQNVAELLILCKEMPRSLAACVDEILSILEKVNGQHGRRARRLVTEFQAKLSFSTIEELFDSGLKTALSDFLEEISQLGFAIHQAYLELDT